MKKIIRHLLQKVGYDIVKYQPSFVRGVADAAALQKEYQWLLNYDFRTIVDIGANEGQFSDKVRALFPTAVIYAFEPLPDVFERLKNNFNDDQKYHAINLGLGERKDELEFYENEYSPSSSFLTHGDLLEENFEGLSKTKKVKVNVDTLDTVFSTYKISPPLLVKIDVQGFEDKVISGGVNILKKASMIICEVSFVELYKGQLLFAEIFDKFRLLGFSYVGSMEQLRSPETNQILQADGIFIRKENA